MWSNAASVQWAKFDIDDGVALSLRQHLMDAQGVAAYLWDEWLAQSLKTVLSRYFGSAEAARKWCMFYAGIHDIGKASAAFQTKIPELFSQSTALKLDFKRPVAPNDLKKMPHGMVGANTLFKWLRDEHAFWPEDAETFISPVGGHHGKFPSFTPLEECRSQCSRVETSQWEPLREEFLETMCRCAGLTEQDIENQSDKYLPGYIQMLLTGIVVVADWIASNTSLFPLGTVAESIESRVQNAIDALDLPDPWDPQPVADPAGLFRERFSLPAGCSPYPVQLDAISLAQKTQKPSLILIEAATGEGKTEAALGAAEVLAAKFGCGGVQVALPTCATSDAMFSRVLKWLDKAIPEDQLASAMLTHSRAEFNDEFQGLKLFGKGTGDNHFSAIYDDDFADTSPEPAVEAHWWLRSRKTSALADFTVGTIDQFLFAALQSKHVMLRHVGLASKVLILDEIHAADTYMQQYLYRALEWCGAYGVPVVALSATLPPSIRSELIRSYTQGQASAAGSDNPPAQFENDLQDVATETAYPLLTSSTNDGIETCRPKPSARSQTTSIEYCDYDDIFTQLDSELADGGCAVVICNTVGRAQELYKQIQSSEQFQNDDIFLLHSRFTAADRRRKEQDLISKYGKRGKRPHRGVVVATQVVEQSLDVDFDIMFSDFAPMDLLIQRIGRLHRHHRPDRPDQLKTPRLVLFGCDKPVASAPPAFAKGSKRIYGESLLLRTAAALLDKKQIKSPDDIASLVRATYSEDPVVPVEWEEVWTQAENDRDKLAETQAAKAARSLGPVPDEFEMSKWFDIESNEEFRGQSQVRDIEESIEVVLVAERDGQLFSLPWLEKRGGESLDNIAGIDDELAREVAKCTVSIPIWQIGDGNKAVDSFIRELEGYGREAWQHSSWLKGLLPMPLKQNGQSIVNDTVFVYDQIYGLEVLRKDKK